MNVDGPNVDEPVDVIAPLEIVPIFTKLPLPFMRCKPPDQYPLVDRKLIDDVLLIGIEF